MKRRSGVHNSPAQGARIPEGMPFSFASASPHLDAVSWLHGISQKADLLLEMRPDSDPELVRAIKRVRLSAGLALLSLEAGMAEAAVRHAMRALDDAWWIEVGLGMMPKLRRDYARRLKSAEGGKSGHHKNYDAVHEQWKQAKFVKRGEQAKWAKEMAQQFQCEATTIIQTWIPRWKRDR